MTEEFKVTVEGIAFGGKGIARQDGFVLFVPYTAPGDVIKCRITQKKKTFANAELLEILSESPLRAIPRCPYFGTCGGCQLQHLSYQSQLDYKQQTVSDALKRIGHLQVKVQPTVSSNQKWEYRRHVTLTLRSFQNRIVIGYISNDNASLLEVKKCPIFIPLEDPLIQLISEALYNFYPAPFHEGKLTIFKSEKEQYLLYFQLPTNIEDHSFFTHLLADVKPLSGIVVKAANNYFSFGETQLQCSLEGMIFSFMPGAFIQNHPEQSQNIYKNVITLAQKSQPKRVLDLYCGIGISSLLLAKEGFSLCGVEENPLAIELAHQNAITNKIDNVQFIQADVQQILKDCLKKYFELVIVNPPRVGLDPRVIKTLLQHPPKEIIYISCMPSTLARDLSLLCDRIYEIKYCQPFDMFPQTAHVETLVHLSKI